MRKSIMITAGAALFGMAAASIWYIHGYHTYEFTFLPKTTVNGKDVSGLSISQAEKEIQTSLPDITVHYLDDTETIPAKSLNAASSYQSGLKNAFAEQKHSLWFLASLRPSSFEVTPSFYYDTSHLDELARSFSWAKEYEEPADARIIYQEGMFQIQKEIEGTKPDIAGMEQTISSAIQNGIYDIDVSKCRDLPKITEEDLSLTDQMRALNERDEITVDIGGEKSCTITKEEFQNAILWDGTTISLDDAEVDAILSSLKDESETLGKERQFTTHDGETVTVGGSAKDDFGYDMQEEETKQSLSDALTSGASSFAVSWKQKGNVRTDENDFGTTYAEVSILDQHVWYYKNGECVFDSDTVTGLPALGGTTPGVFHILYKQSPSVLRGENYATPVTYWMPFTYTGTGFHDASWRSKFGGTLYLTTGSHGCCNLPPEKAKELYGMIQAGDPVIVY